MDIAEGRRSSATARSSARPCARSPEDAGSTSLREGAASAGPSKTLPLATRAPAPRPPLEGYTFEGFRNADGSVGTKNILGLSMSVQCVAGVLGFAVERIKKELLPRFPNVDDVVAIEHAYGCGVAINAPDAAIPIRTVQNLVRNPNLGGAVLVVSLGCEKLRPERLLPEDAAPEASIVTLQDGRLNGFEAMVAAIMDMAEKRLAELDRRRRETCPASDLVVGLQCGSSDTFSGVTATGRWLRRRPSGAGGRHRDVLGSHRGPRRHPVSPRARPTPRSLGPSSARWTGTTATSRRARPTEAPIPRPATARAAWANAIKGARLHRQIGDEPITGVLAPGERADRGQGATVRRYPRRRFRLRNPAIGGGLRDRGFHDRTRHALRSGHDARDQGVARTALAERWSDLIDLDAGRIATGRADRRRRGLELFHLILDVASGRKKTWADRWGIRNANRRCQSRAYDLRAAAPRFLPAAAAFELRSPTLEMTNEQDAKIRPHGELVEPCTALGRRSTIGENYIIN